MMIDNKRSIFVPFSHHGPPHWPFLHIATGIMEEGGLKNRVERLTMGRVASKYHYKSKGLSSFQKERAEKVEKSL